MRRRTLAALAGATLLVGTPGAATATGQDDATRMRSDAGAVARLQAAVEDGRSAAFDARLLVVAFGSQGPSVVELEVSQAEGDLRVSRGEAWTLGRSGATGYFERAGELLQLGVVEAPGFRSVRLTSKYAVLSRDLADLDTGTAEPIQIVERRTGAVRERLFIDQLTGLVVRRETFSADGEPVRLVAFTDVRLRSRPMRAVSANTADPRDLTALSDDSLAILADVGWHVPTELPAGFTLQGGYALPESEGGSVHLVYSDGLYTMSLYQQFGRLDPGSLSGAVAVSSGGSHAYTWPGSQPERIVWSGGGQTFTVVSDAPDDALHEAVAVLPHRPAPSLPGRMVRGLARVADLAWPFN